MMKLTQEEKRIKIAEACGKEPVCVCPIHGAISGRATPEKMLVTKCPWCGNDLHWEDFPDYFNDLNAMHKAERWLANNTALTTCYWRKVVEVVCDDADEPMNFDECTMFCSITANAAQRAEAFGLTLNLWEAGQ